MFRNQSRAIGVFMVCIGAVSLSVQAAYMQEDWFPVVPGTQWDYLATVSWEDSEGDEGTEGPFEMFIRFEAIDEDIFGQTAAINVYSNGETPGVDGSYHRDSPEGLVTISYGNPNSSDTYDYYANGQLFIPAVMEDGQTYEYSSPMSGVMEIDEGVFVSFTGQADGEIRVIGMELIDTAIGEINALKLEIEEMSTIILPESYSEQVLAVETLWLMEDFGLVKYMEDWQLSVFEDDELVYSAMETTAMNIVPEPTALVVVGMGGLILLRRSNR